MTAFILIILTASGVATAEFADNAACVSAAEIVMSTARSRLLVQAICVPKRSQ